MNRWRLSLLAALCVIVPASPVARSAPVRSERSGLEQVPATAPIVFHLRGVQGTHDRLVTMMQNALPDVLKKFQPQMDDFLQNGFMGRKLTGLVKDGPVFFVVTELPKPDAANPDKTMAFIVAVSDYKKFRDNLMTEEERKNIKDNGKGVESAMIENEMTYFVDRKGFTIITPSEEVANSFTQKQAGIHDRMSKPLADKLMNSDVGVYVNMSMVNSTYGEQMEQMKKQIDQQLGLVANIGDESQKKIIEGFQKAIGPVFQAVQDSQAVLFTVDFRPGGLALHVESEVKGESATASLLVDSRPVEFQELERLPDGRSYYSGLKTSAALYKGIGNLISSFTPTGESKAAVAAVEEIAKAGPSVRLDGYSFPLEGLQVYHYVEPAKAVDAQLKLFQAMGDDKSSPYKGKAVIKKEAEKYGDFKLHSVQLTWDLEKMAEGAKGIDEEKKKQLVEALKGLLGEKMTLWFGTDGKTFVQVNAKDWASAKKLLDQYTKGTGTVGEVKAFREVRKELPPKTSYLGLIDTVHLTGAVVDAFRPLMAGAPIPPGWPNMPARGKMTFVGLAVTLQPRSGSFDLFVSADSAREFYKAVVKPFVNE